MRRLWVAGVLLAALDPTLAAGPVSVDPGDLIARAYHAAFNLDYDEAASLARKATIEAPDDSRTHRTLASVLWMHMLFARGVITVDNYMGSVTKSAKALPPVPVALDVEFQVEIRRAADLADARLKREPNNLDAEQDVASVSALEASYITSVKGSVMSAFTPAKRAFQLDDEVLSKDPNRSSAALVVGVYRYLVSTFSMPTRWFAYLAGFGGGKEKGISLIESAAAGGESHVEASAALMLIYTREGRHRDAEQIAHRLVTEFPRSRVFELEEGAAAARAGLGAEADSILSHGIEKLKTDPRPRFPGEDAYWFYKRSIARTEMRHYPDAKADLQSALGAHPIDWIAGRIHLQIGRIDDLTSQRTTAVTEYKQAKAICEAQNDPICAEEAARLMKTAYTGK